MAPCHVPAGRKKMPRPARTAIPKPAGPSKAARTARPVVAPLAAPPAAGAVAAATSRGSAPNPLERYLGSTVRELRRKHGLTIADISDRTGISRGMLSRIETGQTATSLDTLSRLARALGVSLSALFRNYDVADGGVQMVKKGKGMEVALSLIHI